MVSDQYEVYHVKDVVSQEKTLYHYHDFYEVHATLEGVATFYLDDKQFDIEAGTILLIHYNDLHRIIKQSTDYFERVYIFITPNFLESFSTKWTILADCFQSQGIGKSKVLRANPKLLKEKLAFVDSQPNPEVYGSDIKYRQDIINYMLFLNDLVLSEENEKQPKVVVQNERIEQMIQYISAHLANPLTLEEMEKVFFVSKYYITREFKKHTGITFHQFVMKKKLLYAKQLLKEYRSSSMVYSKCGFQTYSHFLKAFKKEFSMTPKEFLRKENENRSIHFQHFED
ncbi:MULTISPECIES: AraC family transcriptional regulator [unclassified Enterococcus]|uniref:AraC family transcriptional regulator n=1 Tax=unclassified Enterococcus TaxID=2608891 RepID=UPI002473F060|nr:MULTISPECIES: AraC family transcriptional regulator [unclassified Enterococcus]